MKNVFKKNWNKVQQLFIGHYVDARIMFTALHNEIPNMYFIGEMQTGKILDYVKTFCAADIKNMYQHNYYDHEAKTGFFNTTIIELRNTCIVEIGNDYAIAYYGKDKFEWVSEFIEAIKNFKQVPDKVSQPIGFMRNEAVAKN